jgi:hypothetical protein
MAKKLTVEIGADITDFKKKIDEVEYDIRELSKVKLERIRLGLDTAEINNQIKDAKRSLNDLKSGFVDSGNSINTFQKKTKDGGAALTAFSRIAQDAPYGIIGIGNNITNTAEQFGYLVKETGSAGGAVKSMLGSLAGIGGIMMGVSLLVTGLTIMSQKGITVGDVFAKLNGEFDEFADSMNKMSIEAEKTAGKEVASLNALVSVAQDEKQSRNDRMIAVEELQSTYPAYFGNLDKEKILTGDLTTVTKELAKAIVARAEASAIADKIGELASKKLDLQIKKEEAVLKLQKAQSSEKNKVTVTGGTMGATGLSSEGRLASATSTVKDLNQELLEIQTQQDKLAGRLNQKTSESIKLNQQKNAVVKPKVEKVYNTPQVGGVESLITPAPLIDLTGIAVFNGQIDALGAKVKELPGVISTNMQLVSGSIVAPLSAEMMRVTETMMAFSEQANGLVQGAISDVFGSLGEMIGNSMVGADGGLQDAGKRIIGIIGGFLVEFGKLMITTGVGIVIAKKMLTSGNGVAMIAGGVALVAIGTAFAASAKQSQQKAGGSIGGGGGSGGGASTSTGSSGGFSGGSSGGFSGGANGGTVVFEISGTSLIGVLNNTAERNLRIGGR